MSKNIIGLDIGATKIRIGLISKQFKVIKKQTFPTPKEAVDVLNAISYGIEKLYSGEIGKMGLGVAGQIDLKKNLVNFSNNFPQGLNNIPLKKILEKKFKCPVLIDNDAHCFALGEAIAGQGKKFNFIIGVTLGTGIGGGIIIDKKIFKGKNNTAGEIGHQIIEVNGRKCDCGKSGCFEAYASGSAMVKLYKKISGQEKNTFEIEQLFLKGEKNAKLAVEESSHYLAIGLSNLINILNPEAIVLGGGLSNFKKFIDLAKNELDKYLIAPHLKQTPILTSKLDDNAGMIGASLLKNYVF